MHEVTDEMVSRFLSWRLPKDFSSDCGISFKPVDHPHALTHLWPIGTNLLTADQAKAMLEHVLAPQSENGQINPCGKCEFHGGICPDSGKPCNLTKRTVAPSAVERTITVDVPMIEAACAALYEEHEIDLGGEEMRSALEAALRKATPSATQALKPDVVKDAVRFRYLLEDPEGARHLLHLLQQGKGDEKAFRSMVDRLITSKNAAIGPSATDKP